MLISSKSTNNIYSDKDILRPTYIRKNKKNYSFYDEHIKKKEKLNEMDRLVNDYKYINNNKKKYLLFDFNVRQLNKKLLSKLKNEEFTKAVNKEPRKRNISMEDVSLGVSTRMASWIGSNLAETEGIHPFQNCLRSSVPSIHGHKYDTEYLSNIENYINKKIYIERKKLNVKINDLFLDLKDSFSGKKDKILVISRYMIFLNNLIKSGGEVKFDERGKTQKQFKSEGKKNYIPDENDLKSYKEAFSKSIQVILNEPLYNNFDKKRKLKEIQPNNIFEQIMDNVYRKVSYVTQRNLLICEDLVVNLINKEMTEYLNSNVKILDLSSPVKSDRILNRKSNETNLPNLSNQNFNNTFNNSKLDNLNFTQNNFQNIKSFQFIRLSKNKNSVLTPIKERDEQFSRNGDRVFDNVKNEIDKKYLNDSDNMMNLVENDEFMKTLLKTDNESNYKNIIELKQNALEKNQSSEDAEKYKFNLNNFIKKKTSNSDNKDEQLTRENEIFNGRNLVKDESNSEVLTYSNRDDKKDERESLIKKSISTDISVSKKNLSENTKQDTGASLNKFNSKTEDGKNKFDLIGLPKTQDKKNSIQNSSINNQNSNNNKKIVASGKLEGDKESFKKKKQNKKKFNDQEKGVDQYNDLEDIINNGNETFNANIKYQTGLNQNSTNAHSNSLNFGNDSYTKKKKSKKNSSVISKNDNTNKHQSSLSSILKEFEPDRKIKYSTSYPYLNKFDYYETLKTEIGTEKAINGKKNIRRSTLLSQFLSQSSNEDIINQELNIRFNSFSHKLDMYEHTTTLFSCGNDLNKNNFDLLEDIRGANRVTEDFKMTVTSFLNSVNTERSKMKITSNFWKSKGNNSGTNDGNLKSTSSLPFLSNNINDANEKAEAKVLKKISYNMKAMQSKGKKNLLNAEELRALKKKLENLKNLELAINQDNSTDEMLKKNMTIFLNINQDIKYLISNNTNEEEKQKYMEFIEKLESMKKFNSKDYVKSLEKNLLNIKEEIEVIFYLIF